MLHLKIIWMGWWLYFNGSVFDNDHAGVVGWRICGGSLIEKAPGYISKVFGAIREIRRRNICRGCYQGGSNAGTGHLLKFVLFLALIEDYLLWSVEMHGKMIAVQFNDLDQTHMCIDVFSVILYQKYFWNVVDRFHEGYDGKLHFPTMLRSPASMTRDFSFNWHSEMTCDCFSERAWKYSPYFITFSTDISNLFWSDLGTYSSSVFRFCCLEILKCRFWRRVMKSAVQRTKTISNLSWSVKAWKLKWYRDTEIGYPRVCFTVTPRVMIERQIGSSSVL